MAGAHRPEIARLNCQNANRTTCDLTRMPKGGQSELSMWRQALDASGASRPSHEMIAKRAYSKSLRHPGFESAVRDWLEAESELWAEFLAQRISID